MAEELTSNLQSPSRTVVRNTGIVLTRHIANWVINLVLILLVPRYLGDVGLGQLQYGQSFAAMFSIAISFGARQLLVREIARRGEGAAELLGTAVTIRIVSSIAVLGIIAVAVEISDLSGDAAYVVYAASGAMVALAIGQLSASALHGFEEMRLPALADTASRVVIAGAGVAVLLSGSGVFAYAMVLMLGTAVYAVLVTVAASTRISLRPRFSRAQARLFFLGGLPFAITAAVITLYANADSVMVREFSGEAAVGWYAAAMRIVGATEILPAAIATALLPTLARTHAAGSGGASRMSHKAMAIVAAVLVPVAFILAANADLIMDVLPIPDEFANSAPVLRILAISIPLTALLTVTGSIAAGADRQKEWAAVLVAGLAVNVLLNLVLIPLFEDRTGNGATGAAVATLISEAVIMVIGFRVMGSQALSRAAAVDLIKVTVAAGAMTGVALLGSYADLHFVLWNVLALAAYAGLTFALQVVTLDDISYLRNALMGRVRREQTG